MAKKKLTRQEEFDIMKLVFDKFLWAGTLIMLYGLWQVVYLGQSVGYYALIGGAVVLAVFVAILHHEYEVLR